MVSKNLERIGKAFNDMVVARDIAGLVTSAAVVPIGAVMSEAAQDFISGTLGQQTDPSGSRGLAVSSVIKMVFAGILGFVAVRTGGSMTYLIGLAGIGALSSAGLDLFNAFQAAEDSANSAIVRSSGCTSCGSSSQKKRQALL